MTADLPARLQTIRAELEAVTDHEAMPFRRVKSSDGSGTGVVDNHGSVIAYGCCIAVADLIASAPDTVAKLLGAVEGVVGLHKPLDVFEYDDMNGVFKLDEDGEQIPAGSFCQECSDPDVIQSIEDCEYDTSGGYGEVSYPCPTVRALTDALGEK